MKIVKNQEEYGNLIMNSKIPVLVDFYADWCGPCKRLTPILENYEKEFTDKILFLKVNVDNEDCGEICNLYDVSSMPTVIFIKEHLENKDLRVIGFDENLIKLNIENLIK